MNQQTRNILFMVSSIAVIIGAAMPLFMLKMPWVPYIYAFGAAGMAVCRLTFRYKGKNFRLKRLYHIETFSSLFLVASSYFMFKEDPDWIMLLTVAAVLQLYTSILIPRVSKKEKNKLLPTSPLPCPVALRGVSVREYRGSAQRARGLEYKEEPPDSAFIGRRRRKGDGGKRARTVRAKRVPQTPTVTVATNPKAR